MTTAEELIRDIDQRVAHITAQVSLGADRDEVSAEQAKSLLATFSKLNGLELPVVTAVSKHLQNIGGWDRDKLAAFNACLRAALGNRLHQPVDMTAARIRESRIRESRIRKPCRFPWMGPTSESDPTVAPEPVVPKPKGKARKGRKAVANAEVKAVAAAKAPITKRPAAATIAKRPAAAPAKLDKFNIDVWMEENASRVEARNETRRHNFLSRVHHRAIKTGIQGLVRGKAAKIWDSVHNVG